jgi:hypothetical protein
MKRFVFLLMFLPVTGISREEMFPFKTALRRSTPVNNEQVRL